MSSFHQYPDWSKELARKYLGKTLNQFILHGNIRDKVILRSPSRLSFISLKTFLTEELFASRDIILLYDRSSGVQFINDSGHNDFKRAVFGTTTNDHDDKVIPTDPGRLFPKLDQYFRLRSSQNKSIACIMDYAETIVPISETGSTGIEDRNSLVFLLKWAQDPLLLSADFTLTLISQNLTDLNKNLIQSPHNSSIKIGLPNTNDRSDFINSFCSKEEFQKLSSVSVDRLSSQTAGLSMVNIEGLLSVAKENKKRITPKVLLENKKELIEAEAYDLLEFVDSSRKLDDVAGHDKVKNHLKMAADAIKNNRLDVLPMGYLICGPVGTGKTYLVNCFAGEVGIPMIKLKNFRSQWQGVTEGNLEKILSLIQAMAPIAVMIDEADAYLGNRESSGDSGVSSRVFSKIAQFMSNTNNRGRIIWFLMTARPDLMPVDLKRQGRAEEHLPLFPPSTKIERKELFRVMVKKTGIQLEGDSVPDSILKGLKMLSGADMEAVLTRAMFKASALGYITVSNELLEEVCLDFIPPSYPDEIELQTLAAIVECTSLALLPDKYKEMDRSTVASRLEILKRGTF